MDAIPSHLQPNRARFAADPFGYAALTGYRWAFAQAVGGVSDRQADPNASRELKSPVLWLAHAHAMSEAAAAVLKHDPAFDSMPPLVRGLCDGQYCAAGLMLVGYSLEICLKAMCLIKTGVGGYASQEQLYRHHDLLRLSKAVPDLTEKDNAILQLLTHFVTWAGRYPDPGQKREADTDRVFALSERHRITANDLFTLVSRIMRHVATATETLGDAS